jgi:hypothetical protein
MEFYYFGGHFGDTQVSRIESHHFSGILFTYDIGQGDFFTKVARDIKHNKKIKYMIALRPYVMSPQYLFMIAQSINEIMPNRLEINLISGHIKDHEKNKGGIMGPLNDLSSNIERSNYLIEYLNVVDEMKKSGQYQVVPDYYVSTSNQYVYNAAVKTQSKMIIQYREYMQGHWNNYKNYQTDQLETYKGEDFNLLGQKVMVSISAVLRKTREEIDSLEKIQHTTDTAYYSYDEFEIFIDKLKKDGIIGLMFIAWPPEEVEHFMDFVKQYKEKELAMK